MSAVQRGEVPARNVVELVDAIRQDLAGAGARLSSLQYLWDTDAVRFGRGDERKAFVTALAGLAAHLERTNRKCNLAREAYAGEDVGKRVRILDGPDAGRALVVTGVAADGSLVVRRCGRQL